MNETEVEITASDYHDMASRLRTLGAGEIIFVC